MMSTQPTTNPQLPGPNRLVEQLADIIGEAIDFITTFGAQYGSEPIEGSSAYREMSGECSDARALTLSSDDVYRSYSQGAGVCIPAVEQFMIALRQLFVTPMSVLGYQTVTRSLVETSAQAWWLIDPRTDLSTRMARLFVDQLENIYALRKLEKDEGMNSMYNLRLRSLLDTTTPIGLIPTYARLRDGSNGDLIGFNGVVPMKATMLVNDFFGAIRFADGDRWYRLVSGVAHGGAHGLLRNFEINFTEMPYRGFLTPHLDDVEISNFAILAIHSYLGAVQAYAEAFGHDYKLVESTRTTFQKRIRDFGSTA